MRGSKSGEYVPVTGKRIFNLHLLSGALACLLKLKHPLCVLVFKMFTKESRQSIIHKTRKRNIRKNARLESRECVQEYEDVGAQDILPSSFPEKPVPSSQIEPDEDEDVDVDDIVINPNPNRRNLDNRSQGRHPPETDAISVSDVDSLSHSSVDVCDNVQAYPDARSAESGGGCDAFSEVCRVEDSTSDSEGDEDSDSVAKKTCEFNRGEKTGRIVKNERVLFG